VDARVAAAAVASVLLLGACGVEAQDQAQELDTDSVPFDLLESEAPLGPVLREGNTFTVYVLQEDSLVAVTRAVRKEPTVPRALRVLFRGITPEEAEVGQRSAIPPGSEVRRVIVRGDAAVVDLNSRFLENVPGDTALALGQVVYTATSLQGVTRIRFRVDGDRVTVPRGDGTLSSGAVSRNDYPGPGP
jgi:spore germination protein GerM